MDIGADSKEDSKFVDHLLSVLFEPSVLKTSSYGGGKSNYNNKAHDALDASKLSFLNGRFLFARFIFVIHIC